MNNLQTGDMPTISGCFYGNATANQLEHLREIKRRIRENEPVDETFEQTKPPKERKIPMATQQRRIVQVFIADANDNVPMDQAVLFVGKAKFTDLTDQELYFELPMKDILAKHNEARVKMLDKDASRKTGKDIFLEPVKIRDLKMVVVNIATF
jgi:hypothetical protein